MTDDQIYLMAIDEDTIKGLFGAVKTMTEDDLRKNHGVKLVGYGPKGIGTGSWSKCQYLWWKHEQASKVGKHSKLNRTNQKKRDRRNARKAAIERRRKESG